MRREPGHGQLFCETLALIGQKLVIEFSSEHSNRLEKFLAKRLQYL